MIVPPKSIFLKGFGIPNPHLGKSTFIQILEDARRMRLTPLRRDRCRATEAFRMHVYLNLLAPRKRWLEPWDLGKLICRKLIFYFGETFIILCMIRSRLVGLTPFSIFLSGHVTALDARKNHLFGRQGCRSDAPLHAGIPPPSPSRWSPQYLACVLCICLVSYLVFYLVSCLLSCCCCMVLS